MIALLLVAAPAPAPAAAPAAPVDIVVTAQRRAEPLGRVPASIAAYTQATLDARGVRRIEDIARLTPGLRFTRTAGVAGNTATTIAIRGIASDVGTATTAIYIDDMPIQIRNIGYFSGNPYPRIFDLASVEILRGPQGTLFGAGAEGGAVRFLTPAPDPAIPLAIYARAEASATRHGAPSSEAGVAIGGAIGPTLAIRASGWVRRDGGTIDRTDSAGTITLARDIDAQRTYAGRIALAWQPLPALTITPSLFRQRIAADGRAQAWEGKGRGTGIANAEPSRDAFTLPALKLDADLGPVALVANAALFRRAQRQSLDYTTYLSTLRSGSPFGSYANKDAANAIAMQAVRQRNATQELRVQSTDPAARIGFTLGAYHAVARQAFRNLSGSGRTPGALSSGFFQYLGRYNLFDDVRARDTQHAAFASIDLRPLSALTLTAGARVTRSRFAYAQTRDGPTNGGAATRFAARQHDTAVTPRIAASVQAGGMLFYASAAKGFRQGGAQGPVDPGFCAADLATLGLAASPAAYAADSLWSTEVGAKARLLGGRLAIDASAYRTRWRNIQQSIRLPRCGFAYIGNLGRARGRGADLAFAAGPFGGLTLGAALGYGTTRYAGDVIGGNGLLIRRRGDRVAGPKLNGSAYAELVRGPVYLRADYSHAGRDARADPATFGYDPGLRALGASDLLGLRGGARWRGLDLSLFVDNVADSHRPLARAHDAAGSPLYFVETPRPRTLGATAQWRY